MSEEALDPQMAARFLRQILLAEIGSEGQALICKAQAAVCGEGLRYDIASRYAGRAGFGRLSAGAIDLSSAAPHHMVRTEAAREVLAGARASLAEIRRALQLSFDKAPVSGGN